MTADAAYRVGDFPRALSATGKLRADAASEAERLRALDMIERIAWAQSQPRAL